MVPAVGTIKATVECVTGRDIISGDPVDRAERGLTAAASLAPGGSALAKTVKVASSAYDTYQAAAGAAEVVETIVEGGTPNPMDVAGMVIDVVDGKRNSGGGGHGNGHGVQAGGTHSPDGSSPRDHSQGNDAAAPATAGNPNEGGTAPHPGEPAGGSSGPTMAHTGSGGGGGCGWEGDRGPVHSRHYSSSPDGVRLHNEAQAYRQSHPDGANRHRNFATADVSVNGTTRTVKFKNDPGGMHSEQRLVAWEDAMRKRGKDVSVQRVYTERPPCGPMGANCRDTLGNRYGSNLEVYHGNR